MLGITDRWLDPAARYFKVSASDGRRYLLRCDGKDSTWSLVKTWVLDA